MKIGSIYKKIRVGKSLSQSDVCGTYISRTTLSRFENEQSSISLDTFLYLVSKLDISLEEFMYIYNKRSSNSAGVKQQIITRFMKLRYSENDKYEIEDLIISSKTYLKESNDFYISSIHTILSVIQNNDVLDIDQKYKNEIGLIWKEMIKKNSWYLLDFHIINCIMFNISENTVEQIGYFIVKKLEKYNDFNGSNSLLAAVYGNLGYLFLNRSRPETSTIYFKKALKIAKEIKRFDHLIINTIRIGISEKDFSLIGKGLQLINLIEDEKLSTAIKIEIEALFPEAITRYAIYFSSHDNF